jgi:hypothetical protein
MRRSRFVLIFAVLVAGLAYLGAWHAADSGPGITPSTEGLMAPLDDAYIFGQYARQALHGQWLHYTPGAPLSTGVSSATWLLGLTALMGLGWPLTWAAWALGMACLAWSAHSLLRLSPRIFPQLPDWLLPLLFLAHASSVSLYFQGMDTGLLLAALFATAEAALDPEGSARFWALGAILVFTRPEGQIAFPAIAWARALPGQRLPWRSACLALALAALPTAGLWVLSGSPVPDSVRPKTAALGRLDIDDATRVAGLYAAQVSGELLLGLVPPGTSIGVIGNAAAGNDPAKHFPPLALAIAAFGLWLACRDPQKRSWWLGLAAAWLATLALLSWTLPVGWHRHRYLAPLWPLMLLGFSAALNAWAGMRGPWPRAARSAALVLWLGFGAMTWPWFVRSCYQSGRLYAAANREAAFDLKALPLTGPVAIEDAGLIAYYGGHETVDLLGVTDHKIALAQRAGHAAVLQELLHLPPQRRPAQALLHPTRMGSYSEVWSRLGLLDRSQALATMRLYHFHWDEAAVRGDSWELDHGWLESEAKWWLPEATVPEKLVMCREGGLDTGRVVSGEDRFRMPAHGPGTLLVRCKLPSAGSLTLADGRGQTLAAARALPAAHGYTEESLALPSAEAQNYSLRFVPDAAATAALWASFHDWFIPKP